MPHRGRRLACAALAGALAAGGIRVNNKEELRKTAKIRPGQRVQAGDVRIRVVAASPTDTPPSE